MQSDETMPEPDKAPDPDLEPGGDVKPGATPPEEPQTSGVSADQPVASGRFPSTGGASMIALVVLVVVFIAVAIGLIVWLV